jgi:hypothetical protein
MRQAVLLATAVLLSGCGLFEKKPPAYVAAPSIGTAQRGVTDAKDFVGRAQHKNDQITEELDALEKEIDQ